MKTTQTERKTVAYTSQIVYTINMSGAVYKLLENYNALTIEEKEYAKDVIEQAEIEARREEMYQNVLQSRKDNAEGKIKFGSAKDILKSLNAD